MLVYADRSERADARDRLDALAGKLRGVAARPPGIDRHAKLVGALIEAGQLLQGVADAGLPADQLDAFVYELASAVVRSWDSRFAEFGALPTVPRMAANAEVELRLPEGFAFYAVYPEAYVEAARRVRLVGPARVIGIRSIGTTLGAVVAAALGAGPPVTVRPAGDPFAREVELPGDVIDGETHYVIVDEGPGLSGSSFGAVADQLERRGIPRERIAFMPSHDADLGPRASEAHRARWRTAQRLPAQFSPTFLNERFGALTPFSTGSPGERLKFLAQLDGERVLLKFAGLGSIGERKLDLARALHATGFTPEPLGLIHGFLVERWCGHAQPLGAEEKPVGEIGRYIGARARLFPADPASGANIRELLRMSRRNIGLSLGEGAAQALHRWDAQSLERRVARVRTDNKLDRHEWLRGDDGRLIKTDALDHHQGHDLIGCQDVAWDVAGAAIEFALTGDETERLVPATGLQIDPRLLEFYSIAYCSFRLGQAQLAGAGGDTERYAAALNDLLHLCVP